LVLGVCACEFRIGGVSLQPGGDDMLAEDLAIAVDLAGGGDDASAPDLTPPPDLAGQCNRPCSGGCAPCCNDVVSGTQGFNQMCSAGCTCSLMGNNSDNIAQSCSSATCSAHVSDGNATINCSHSTCDVTCDNSNSCNVSCTNGSRCRLRCINSNSCHISGCPAGKLLTCSDGFACDVAC
jgi:hypothetical protein